MVRALRAFPLWFAVLLAAAHAQRPALSGQDPTAARSVVLVSLNGFRYDYAKKFDARHLLAIAARGASAPDGMIPAYPPQSFPDLYTLATGLYPARHGIVADAFYDPARKQVFRGSDPNTADDGSWYGGIPLWSLAEMHGLRGAVLAWPGSRALIAGERPTYSDRHDAPGLSSPRQIEQILAWLRLPADKRPRLIATSFADVDRAAQKYGPDAPQTAAAVRAMDHLIGVLERGIDGLSQPIDLVVVSDHGMARVEDDWVTLDAYASLAGFTTVGQLLYAPSESAANSAYQKLKAADARFMVYRRANVPAELHFSGNAREGDPIIVARGPYAIRALADGAPKPPPGADGFDPFMTTEMRGIFYAEGPGIRAGTTLRPFESVNLYPLIADILGLPAPPTDGNANVLSGILLSH